MTMVSQSLMIAFQNYNFTFYWKFVDLINGLKGYIESSFKSSNFKVGQQKFNPGIMASIKSSICITNYGRKLKLKVILVERIIYIINLNKICKKKFYSKNFKCSM